MIRGLRKWFKGKEETGYGELTERISNLQSALGIVIPAKYQTVFLQALRHRSIIDDNRYKAYETYERLEFLGDAVLDLVITEILFEKFPKEDEGFLTKLRAKIVRGDTLAMLALKLNINKLLEVGERASEQKIEFSKSVLADVFESVIAAIYLSKGYTFTHQFVSDVVNKHIDFVDLQDKVDNHKSVLMEYLQALKKPLPEYRVLSEEGPGHDKIFTIGVFVDGEIQGEGSGKSKKQAEQIAAQAALENIIESE